MNILSPSILTANFCELKKEIDLLEEAGVEYIHLDIMDGKFVPNITFGPKIISDLRSQYNLVFDAHLMVEKPELMLDEFAKAGCDIITIHAESTTHLHRQIQYIKSLGKKAGVSLNPHTPLSELEYIIDDLDQILIMSVNPGFGGQSFIPAIMEKIKKARNMIGDRDIMLQVDGGIKLNNVKDVLSAGANSIVVGSAIFDGENVYENAREFLEILNKWKEQL